VTSAEDLVTVVADLKLMLPADSALEVFDGRAGELDDRSATEADQVVVVLPPEDVLIVSLLPSQVYPFDEPAPDEKLQSPVDCGPGDPGVLSLQMNVESISSKMPLGVERSIEHHLSLRSHPEPL
jgi:hypothetical protein